MHIAILSKSKTFAWNKYRTDVRLQKYTKKNDATQYVANTFGMLDSDRGA